MRLIRSRFLRPSSQLRRLVDSTDISQEAWKAVFETIKNGKIPEQDHFVHFLLTVTRNCSLKAIRYLGAEKRSSGREESLERGGCQIVAMEPGPASLVASAEEWELFLADLLPVHRVVIVRALTGEPLADIAKALCLNVRAVQRILERIRGQWHASAGGPG
jgi:DNA-directed RNA polymerase specialized sigma24 family protein